MPVQNKLFGLVTMQTHVALVRQALCSHACGEHLRSSSEDIAKWGRSADLFSCPKWCRCDLQPKKRRQAQSTILCKLVGTTRWNAQPGRNAQLVPMCSQVLACLIRGASVRVLFLMLLLSWDLYKCPSTMALASACLRGFVDSYLKSGPAELGHKKQSHDL